MGMGMGVGVRRVMRASFILFFIFSVGGGVGKGEGLLWFF